MKYFWQILFFISILFLLFQMYEVVPYKEGRPAKRFAPHAFLQVLWIMNEDDCISCIEDLTCNWDLVNSSFQEFNIDESRLILATDGAPIEYAFNCQNGEYIVIPKSALRKMLLLPIITPTVYGLVDGYVVYQKPFLIGEDIQVFSAGVRADIEKITYQLPKKKKQPFTLFRKPYYQRQSQT